MNFGDQIWNPTGRIIYHHAAGRQSLDAAAPPLAPDSTIVLASAGKFITHIAALQLVERGLVDLDAPVAPHLPELDSLLVIPLGGHAGTSAPFTLRPATKKITLRHLLLHSSGLSDPQSPLMVEYLASDAAAAAAQQLKDDDAHVIAKMFSLPLAFEPGEGFAYGCSIHWTSLLITRVTGGSFVRHVQQNVFDLLGMTTATYMPQARAEVWDSRLRMVQRLEDSGRLAPAADDASQGLTCSMTDMAVLLADLVSPSPRLLRQKHLVDVLFEGQFAASSAAIQGLRGYPENYGFCSGKPSIPHAVN